MKLAAPDTVKTFSSLQLGLRVKHAREARGLNQEELRQQLGFKDRQTISDIETGKRSLKADELLSLSEALDRDVEYFLDPFSVVAEAQYCWRASPQLPSEELDRFEGRSDGWVGLLRWLRGEHKVTSPPLKPMLRLTAQSPIERAELYAEQLVEAYKLGPVPAEKLVEFLSKLDISVLFVEMGEPLASGSISAAACQVGDLGVILVNRLEPAARRYFDLAHAFFHTLTWDALVPEPREASSIEPRKSAKRIEQLANSFVAALLMPTASLEQLIEPERCNDVSHLAEVADKLHVPTEALGWRLFQLGRIDEEARAALAEVRGLSDSTDTPKPFSKSFVEMLHVALDRGWLSARKAAKSMGMTLGELAELFETHEMQSPFAL